MKNIWAKAFDLVNKLNFILSGEQKKYGLLVLIMALISAVFEMLGVSIILPLLDAFLAPDTLMEKSYIKPLIQIFHLENTMEVIFVVCLFIIALYITKNAYSSFYCWVSSKYSCKISRELGVRVLSIYMKQGYAFFTQNNSARLLRGMENDVENVYNIIVQLINILSKALTIGCIAVFMIAVTPGLSFFLIVLVIFCFVLTQLIFRKPMRKYGEIARDCYFKNRQAALEAIQGSKEVLVKNRQAYFVKKYEQGLTEGNRANVKLRFSEAAPTYVIEAICITGLMSVVAVQMLRTNGSYELLAHLSTIAIAAFRILPALGAILCSVNNVMYATPALSATYETIDMVKSMEKEDLEKEKSSEKDDYENVVFTNEIKLDHIVFGYQGDGDRGEHVIDDLSLTIKREHLLHL